MEEELTKLKAELDESKKNVDRITFDFKAKEKELADK